MGWSKPGTRGAGGGADGKSAYEIWLEQGNIGTEEEFTNSLKGPIGPIGPVGPVGEIGLGNREPVTYMDFYFEGTMTTGSNQAIPCLVFDCSDIPDFASGGEFTFSFTPDTTGSVTSYATVDNWFAYALDDRLTGGALTQGTQKALVSGTRLTWTFTSTPPTGRTFMEFLPRFTSTGATGTAFKIKMTDITITFKGNPIPLNTLVNAGGHAAYTPNITSTKITKTRTYTPNKLQSRWAGRKMCVYGDSITDYSNGQPTSTGYPRIVADMLGIYHLMDKAASGQCTANITAQPSNNWIVQNAGASQDFDLICIALGVNDYNFNTPIGNIGNRGDAVGTFDKATFAGAMRFVLHTIFTANPFATVVWFTPIYKQNEGANTAGHTLDDYRNTIVTIGKMYNIPIFRAELCMNPVNQTTFMYDGLHINGEGHIAYANALAPYLAGI